MAKGSSAIALVFSAALLAAAPESFTIDEVDALEAERRAALAQLEALESSSTTAARDLEVLDSQLISAAMESRRREEQAAAAERHLVDLRARLLSTRETLLEDRADLEDLLGVIAVSGRERPPALIISPARANEAVRRAIIAGDAGPRLADRVAGLASEIDMLNQLEANIRQERARLETAEAVLALRQAEIETLTLAKRSAYEATSGDVEALRARVAALGAEAESLRQLLADLEATAPIVPGAKPEMRPRLASINVPDSPQLGQTLSPVVPRANMTPLGEAALGQLARPVSGLVARGYGDRVPGGGTAEGITIQTRSGAQVAAPIDGRIEYAGKFRSYGEMLILRTSDDYHVILSGMGRIYGSVGQTVRAGEPVGQMSARNAPAPELYLELRRGENSMNPALWMKRGR